MTTIARSSLEKKDSLNSSLARPDWSPLTATYYETLFADSSDCNRSGIGDWESRRWHQSLIEWIHLSYLLHSAGSSGAFVSPHALHEGFCVGEHLVCMGLLWLLSFSATNCLPDHSFIIGSVSGDRPSTELHHVGCRLCGWRLANEAKLISELLGESHYRCVRSVEVGTARWTSHWRLHLPLSLIRLRIPGHLDHPFQSMLTTHSDRRCPLI